MKGFWGTRASRSVFGLSFALCCIGCGSDDKAKPVPASGDEAPPDASTEEGGTADGAVAPSGLRTVEIDFEARVGDAPFVCTQTYEVGTAKTTVMPLDFRLYVHDVVLLTAEGEQPVVLAQDGVFQHEGVALLDFEDDTGTCSNGTQPMHTKIVGEVPAGDYTGLSFKIGVPEELNHRNQAVAPSPLNIEGMFWSWTTGYKFLRIDVMPTDSMQMQADAGMGDGATGFNVHLGSTMCAGNASAGEPVTCQRENRPMVRITKFDFKRNKIIVDLAELLSTSDVSQNMGAQPGCMSGATDPDCPALFDRLGLDLNTGASIRSPSFLRVVEK